MNSLDVLDSVEINEFFRRGDEGGTTVERFEPPPELESRFVDVDRHPSYFRTPEQAARRRRFIRYVSFAIGGLVLVLVLLFTTQVLIPNRARPALSTTSVGLAFLG
jgi:hypothetical protein